LCVGLPRHDGQNIRLFGVICQDKNGTTCFWDNQENDVSFDIDLNATVDIEEEFAYGEELNGGTGGTCTACHAGENLLVIHPNTALLPNSYDTSTNNWAVPDVHSSWPQNPGPGTKLENLDSAQVCASCHNAGTSRRFPKLQGMNTYCNVVLKRAIGDTMPDPGGSLISDINLLCDKNPANDPVNTPPPTPLAVTCSPQGQNATFCSVAGTTPGANHTWSIDPNWVGTQVYPYYAPYFPVTHNNNTIVFTHNGAHCGSFSSVTVTSGGSSGTWEC